MLKVNDSSGNPIEIAAVVVWCIEDTARAVFAVENYSGFIAQQAVEDLQEKGVVQLDAAQRARLVTNLMTVLVSASDTTPVVPLPANIDSYPCALRVNRLRAARLTCGA
jgi:hypothetical protein